MRERFAGSPCHEVLVGTAAASRDHTLKQALGLDQTYADRVTHKIGK